MSGALTKVTLDGSELIALLGSAVSVEQQALMSAVKAYANNGGTSGAGVFTTLRVTTPVVPASAGAAGAAGTIAWDSGFLYIAVATNTWVRVAIATW